MFVLALPLPLNSDRFAHSGATPLLIRGAGTQLTLDNLDPISADLDAIPLWERGNARWQKEKLRGGKHPLVWTLIKAFPSALFAPVVPCVVYCEFFARRAWLSPDSEFSARADR